MKRLAFFAFCWTVALDLAPAAEPVPGLFQDGDRWAAVGDSITHGGSYYAWTYLYYATRFPDRALEVANRGISGDTSGGAVRRYAWDIQPAHATVATVMLGMNDVGRSLYGAAPAAPEIEERRAAALEAYRKNMTELVRRLRADGVRVVLITPTPYDEWTQSATPPLTGVDGALDACAAFEKELAAANQLPLVEFHAPMKELARKRQAAAPAFTFNRPDRVHPEEPGHLVMAYLLLKAQGAPAEVSSVSVDAASLAVDARNAEVSGLKGTARGVAFDCREKALPFPIAPEARPALDDVPFLDELDRETLQVKGLEAGGYRLAIDGTEVGRFTAAELKAGVNLAREETTPQYLQAVEIMETIQKWRTLTAGQKRLMAQVEHGPLRDLPHPVDLAAAQPILDKQLAGLKDDAGSSAAHIRANLQAYPEARRKEAETDAQLAAYVARIRSLAQPKSHRYEISPAGA